MDRHQGPVLSPSEVIGAASIDFSRSWIEHLLTSSIGAESSLVVLKQHVVTISKRGCGNP